MFYDKQPNEKKNNYKNMLKIVGSLSRMFSESDVPYLYYRAYENLFAKYFDLINNSRSDDSADAYSTKGKIGIDLKTWVGQDNQKVAEFGKLRPKYEHLRGKELVDKIAEYRNERIRITKNAHGLETMLYHIVKRIPGAMYIYEATFDFIDIPNIVLDEKRGNDNSIYFSDGKHTYHFSLSKNTLYMIFDAMEELDSFKVEIIEDPYELLSTLLKNKEITNYSGEVVTRNSKSIFPKDVAEAISISVPKKDKLCLRLYSTKADGTKFVANKSGLNQWNAGGRARDINELYIPYPAIDRERNNDFFPPRDISFDLMLPNGEWIGAKVCQGAYTRLPDDSYNRLSVEERKIEDKRRQTGKAIMSNPNLKLGKWLLRDVFELKPKTIVTYDMLKVFGVDSVMFTKLGKNKYSVEFCDLGTYEKFYNLITGPEENDMSEE
ncbi:MAG: hypothetical protein IJS61_06570 [Firmicutes bacterium]|nr:hypothetical protein [Bacillota bacterium]